MPGLLLWLLALTAGPDQTQVGFRLLDVESVEGRSVVVYRPVELGPRPVRPLKFDEALPTTTIFGLATVGSTPDSALAVAWNAKGPDGPSLWVDADGDGRLSRSERHVLRPGKTLAITATITGKNATSKPGGTAPESVHRTLLFRPGLLGEGPRFAVKGAMSGALVLGGKTFRALLTDGNADGCFDAAGVDRIWVDLDDDGRFDAVTERFPLGAPITLSTSRGTAVYTMTSDPWACSVAAHERDNRLGRLELGFESTGVASSLTSSIESVSASLVSESGELVTILDLGKVQDVLVGDYRLASLELHMVDQAAKVWSYTFTGGRRATITVVPDRSKIVRAELLGGLAFDVAVVRTRWGKTRRRGECDADLATAHGALSGQLQGPAQGRLHG